MAFTLPLVSPGGGLGRVLGVLKLPAAVPTPAPAGVAHPTYAVLFTPGMLQGTAAAGDGAGGGATAGPGTEPQAAATAAVVTVVAAEAATGEAPTVPVQFAP
jgi:hypothetical protein